MPRDGGCEVIVRGVALRRVADAGAVRDYLQGDAAGVHGGEAGCVEVEELGEEGGRESGVQGGDVRDGVEGGGEVVLFEGEEGEHVGWSWW